MSTIPTRLRKYVYNLEAKSLLNNKLVYYKAPSSFLGSLFNWFKHTQSLNTTQKTLISLMVIAVSLTIGYALFAGFIHGTRWMFNID